LDFWGRGGSVKNTFSQVRTPDEPASSV